jgi:hypothetical protein
MEVQHVYWANLCPELEIDLEPKPLLVDIAKSQSQYKGQNWLSCPAIKDKNYNTFLTHIPHNLEVKFEKNSLYTNDQRVTPRQGLYEKSYAFDWDIKRIFFSESPQIMEVTPSYLHKTSYSRYGHAPSGAFDISRWFRPSSPMFQLWPEEDAFLAKGGEAHLYFNFPNNKKIVLKEFYFTEKLEEIMYLNLNHKNIMPKQTLHSVYKMFEDSKRKEIVLSEILRNLK